jgi:hypothetical protein
MSLDIDEADEKQLDYFQWNFMIGFAGITAVVVAGNVTKNIRIVTLGLPLLMVDVSAQLLVIALLHLKEAPAPFRLSSVRRGNRVRSGVYTLAEDIVAVDGGQGQTYRRQLQDRYLASHSFRMMCFHLDLLWSISGIGIGAACIALIFVLEDANVAYILGESAKSRLQQRLNSFRLGSALGLRRDFYNCDVRRRVLGIEG